MQGGGWHRHGRALCTGEETQKTQKPAQSKFLRAAMERTNTHEGGIEMRRGQEEHMRRRVGVQHGRTRKEEYAEGTCRKPNGKEQEMGRTEAGKMQPVRTMSTMCINMTSRALW